MLEIIILSITQGITEFLPISSSAHLILISKYLSFNNENITLDISLHLGSLIAVIFFFKKEIINFFGNKSLFIKVFFSSLPTLIVGYLLIKFKIIEQLRTIQIIGITTILFGLLLYLSDRSKSHKSINELNLNDCVVIGILQIFSLIPGVSRSGITITGARFLNFNRIDSAKISFLLAIPTLLSVSSYSFFKIIELNNLQFTVKNFWLVFFSFVISLITLNFFIKLLKKFSLIFFVIYRILLGFIIFIYVYFL